MRNNLDSDLAALQESRELVRRSRVAATAMARLEPAQAWAIATRVAVVCEDMAEHFARLAVAETGIGRVEDKTFKNRLASGRLMDFHRGTRLGGIYIDTDRRMVVVGRPAGVVMGLVASTSPIATLYFKVLCCLMTRNAIILSPHPIAIRCSTEAADLLASVANAAGAPPDCIQIQRRPTLEATHAMMRNPDIDVILATGGGPMVRTAYSSGNPALGVGPGNVPIYVDRTANLDLAVEEITKAKTFDHGSACSTPSTLFVHADVEPAFRQKLTQAGAFFCDERQQRRLEDYAFPSGRINPRIVGRSAAVIASEAGIDAAQGCSMLVGMLGEVSAAEPMASEKLSTILGYKCVRSCDEAIQDAQTMLSISGAGHTSGVFAEDAETIVLWGASLDVNRTVVNTGTTMGAVGDGTGFAPTFTVGTGYAGRSSIAENVGPEHLVEWKRIAFPIDARPSFADAAPPTEMRALIEAALSRVIGMTELSP